MDSPVTERGDDLPAWLETYSPFGMRVLTVSPVWNRATSGLFFCGVSRSHKALSARFVDNVAVSLVPQQTCKANECRKRPPDQDRDSPCAFVPVPLSTHKSMNKSPGVRDFFVFVPRGRFSSVGTKIPNLHRLLDSQPHNVQPVLPT